MKTKLKENFKEALPRQLSFLTEVVSTDQTEVRSVLKTSVAILPYRRMEN